MPKQKNKQRGITLIALVVSIIVLIILAGVSIAMLVGENGIITQAQRAAQETEQAKQSEEKSLQELEGYIDSSLGGETATTVAEAKGGMRYTNTTTITDDSGDTMYIPGGFKVAEDSATDIDNGVVITDGINEFVWVPVDNDDLAEMYAVVEEPLQLTGVETTTNIYSKLRVREGENFSVGTPNSFGIREPDVLVSYDTDSKYYKDVLGYESINEMASAFVNEYKNNYESIKRYGGFYIGRYELTGTMDSPTVEKNEIVLTAYQTGDWYKLKKACSKIVKTNYAQSTMIYGNQWDKVMNWLIDTGAKTEEQVNTNSSSWGNYNSSEKTSGYNDYWSANNIYDLAGNYYEWTQEANHTYVRIIRGGNYKTLGSDRPASSRVDNNKPNSVIDPITTRVVLYLNV